jgi:2,3-bisphosphoglycerate-dependent phosphoglycerate mutase
MSHLILLRHGQSLWNRANRFTGWVDVPLSEKGITEAQAAGKELAKYPIQAIFTSTLQRAQQTAMIAMAYQEQASIPVVLSENPEIAAKQQIYSKEAEEAMVPCYIDLRLNERHYGELQGLDKQQTRDQYGDEQVHIWRRSFDVPPPSGESLKMTAARTLPCLHERIIPLLEKENACILIAAHGNSLRSIAMDIEGLSTDEVLQLEIATGVPRVYEYTKSEGFHLFLKGNS